jgi:hypothetical protein
MDDLLAQFTAPSGSKPPRRRKSKSPPKTPARIFPGQTAQTVPPKFDLSLAMTNPVILERIRAARRKSMQFAPKVGSPLVNSWRPE